MARNSDINLVIRAKNEAEKTIKSVAEALALLTQSQDGVSTSADRTGSRIDDLQRGLGELEQISKRIASATETSSAAISRQAQSLLSTNAQITDRKNRVNELTRALDLLKSESDKAFIGPQRDGLSQQIKFVQAELRKATGDVSGLTNTFNRELAGLQKARAAFRDIETAQREADGAVVAFTAEIANQTRTLDQNTQAAQRARAAQQFFNNKFAGGLSRTSTTADEQEQIAAVLRVAQARDVEIQKLRAQEAATAELARTQEAQRRSANLGVGTLSGKSASDSAAVFKQADLAAAKQFEDQIRGGANAAKEEAAAIQRLREQMNPLAVIERDLAEETAKLVRWQKAGKISAAELAQATKLLRADADKAAKQLGTGGLDSRGRPSLFGLKPYELQNLSFQINDVFTQLASGASITQTLAQQGGQILQLFPRVGSAVVAGLSSAPVLAFTIAIGALVLGLKEAVDQAATLRNFEGLLAANADGARYQAETLVAAAKALDRYGLSAEDAVAVVRVLQKEGFDQSRITEFGNAAKNLADVLGIEVADAAQQVADAFSSGFDSVDKLDKATEFLTAAQREQIRTLFEEGKAADARNEAFRIFSAHQQDAADRMRGPWSEAARALGNVWDKMISTLADTGPITGAADALDTLALSVASVLNRLSGVTSAANITFEIERAFKRIGELNESIAQSGDVFGLKQQQIDEYVARIKGLNADLEKLQGRAGNGTGGDTVAEDTERQKKVDQDIARADERKLAAAKELNHAKRIQLAYEEALAEAQNKGASAEAARASAQAAALIERRKIEKEVTAEKEKQKRAEEQAIKSFSQKVIGVESGGNPNAKNSKSTATGLGQFIESTWLMLFRENFPDRAKSMSDATILALRTDAEISKQMIDVYARQNAAVLKRAGESVTEANLYLTHFLGPQGALKVIKAASGTTVSALLSQAQIKANPTILGGNATAGSVRQFAANKFGEATVSEGAIETRLAQLEKERLDLQTRFNEKVGDENEKRQLATDSLRAQVGLTGEALIAEQRRQAIAEALLQKQQEIDKLNVDLRAKGQQEIQFTEAQKKAVVETTGAYFDLANAKAVASAQRTAVDQPVSDLTALRDSIQEQIQFLHETGQTGLANQLQPQLDLVNGKLSEAIQKAKDFYAALADNPAALAALGLTKEQVEAIGIKLDTTALSARQFGYFMGISGKQIAQTFSQGAANALDKFAESVANGSNVLRGLRDAFLQFAADFLRQIAQMIQQQIIFNLVSRLLSSFAGSFSGASFSGSGTGAIAGLQAHEGGVIGGAGPKARAVDPRWFANASRFHIGGIAGLRPGEVPAILEQGEEVLTRGDPRHIMNGGGSGGSGPNIKVVNAIDAGDFVSKGLGTATGEKAILNFIRANSGAVKQAIGG